MIAALRYGLLLIILLVSGAGIAEAQTRPAAAPAQSRVVLIVANGRYADVARLPNPPRDADLVAAAFRRAGFTTVQVQRDLTKQQFDQALLRFAAVAARADIAVVYFAGHGIELNGTNWLLPVDARLATSNSVSLEAISLAQVLDVIRDARVMRMVVLDACRTNPFARRLATGGRQISQGLIPVENLPRGTVVAYSASSGQSAADGEGDRNSPFATAFASRLPQPGLEIRFMLAHVRDDVLAANPNGQEPWLGYSLSADEVYLVPGQRRTELASDLGAEVAAFQQAGRAWTPQAFRDFITRYPQSSFRSVAERTLASLTTPTTPRVATAARGVDAVDTAAIDAARRAVEAITPAQFSSGEAVAIVVQVIGASSREGLTALAAAGDPRAQWILGSAYLAGAGGLAIDYAEAARLFRLSSDQGFARGQNAYALLLSRGQSVTRDLAESDRLTRLAAAQGNAAAVANLGITYLNGEGVPRDDAQAARFSRQAAELGSAQGLVTLGVLARRGAGGVEGGDRAALDYFRRAAAMGSAAAQANLGNFYRNGRAGLERDDVEAVRLFRLAAAQNHTMGLARLGEMFEQGRGGLVQDDAEAVRLYRRSADQNWADGVVNLGRMYERGAGGLAADPVEAVRLYRNAADRGWDYGQYHLARMTRDGRGGLRADPAEALRLFRLAAAQGSSAAQFEIGRYYREGLAGTPRDLAEAARWYRRAADASEPDAQYALALMLHDGEGVARDDAEALRLHRLAFASGHAGSATQLGRFYSEGWGVTADPVAAMRYYRIGADRGDAAAQYHLGHGLYRQAGAGEADREEGVDYLRRAARQSSAQAQAELRTLGLTW